MKSTLLWVATTGKHAVTHSRGTLGNVCIMADTGWSRCEGLWDRLQWARLNSPTSQMTAPEAAAVVGVRPGTYNGYERPPTSSKPITINPQYVIKLGRRWKISWQWILSGEGTPFDKELTPLQLRVVAALENASLEMQEAAVESIELLLKASSR